MNNRASLAGVLALSALLAGCGMSKSDTSNSILRLPECSSADTVFAALALDSAVDVYHSTVEGVVAAHFSELTSINTRPLECTANDYRGLLQPSEQLRFLAEQLPEWGSSRTEDLSEADIGPVLLEWLRVYECSLFQRSKFLSTTIVKEMGTERELSDGTMIQTIPDGDFTREQLRQRDIIATQILVSRPALERTLAFMGGADRLRPLSAELECLKRASLDLRNATGLTAETASCMPKIWDARGSLRDLPGEE